MSDEEAIEEAVRGRISRIYGGVIATLLVIFFMVIVILQLLSQGDYLHSVLLGIAIIIAIFVIVKANQRAQRYEQALANRPAERPPK